MKLIWKNGILEENKEIKLQNFYLCEMDIKLTFFFTNPKVRKMKSAEVN